MRAIAALMTAAALALAGCGGDDDAKPTLVVSAAASLKSAFTAYGDEFDAADGARELCRLR